MTYVSKAALVATELQTIENGADLVHTTTSRQHRAEDVVDHPMVQVYEPLIIAFDRFNRVLFEGKLPLCIITLQRDAERVFGYFHADRFGNREKSGVTVDEIALNPRNFLTRSIEETLSTLVHEMAHGWQHHFGKQKSRVGYHNKEWSEKMQDIGLRPTHNGQPDGRLHGQNMTHIIVADGPFDRACRALLSEEFRLAWYDRLTEMTRSNAASAQGGDGIAEPTSGKRVKFTCPTCRDNAWGKASLKLICEPCNARMRVGE
jgi:hypothetical protein